MFNESILNFNSNIPISTLIPEYTSQSNKIQDQRKDLNLPEILFITSYPPRECGIATYSQDLIHALNIKFSHSFKLKICPLESETEKHDYSDEVKYILNTDMPDAFSKLAKKINQNLDIRIIMIQHEFGFFEKREAEFITFIENINKPVIIVFHTVLPRPDDNLRKKVQMIVNRSASVIVMTHSSENILRNDYGIPIEKITVIPHGTHLVPHTEKKALKERYSLSSRNVLSTFGLLSSGKGIETTLDALPSIAKKYPDILFLIIGKTHPSIIKKEGEKYRESLEKKVNDLQIDNHVRFINQFLPLHELLDYLQLTDIYLFTSRDPNQAVSGTFSYAISCGCPVVSTPIPHAVEVLGKNAGVIIDFQNTQQLGDAVIGLLSDEHLRNNISSNGLHRMASTAWENSAVAHAVLFEAIKDSGITLRYSMPEINLDHIKKLTTDFGIIQFSKINQPDIDSGYTLDDNARALIAMCQFYELTNDIKEIRYIKLYLGFINYCLTTEGYLLNYVDKNGKYSDQNDLTNLADANGRAIWALGYLISMKELMPAEIIAEAKSILQRTLLIIENIHSTRAMAFALKGLYYLHNSEKSNQTSLIIKELADRLVQMYRHEQDGEWLWYESYLTYANSILPEAMLCAWLATGDLLYKEIAKSSFDFLLSRIFIDNTIHVISNKRWLNKGEHTFQHEIGGEQPIDVAYTILALSKFYEVFKQDDYLLKMKTAFSWFLGNNHLHQVIYNPCTGGCYDGLEENNVNLNQGAESTISYLMARLTMEKILSEKNLDSLK